MIVRFFRHLIISYLHLSIQLSLFKFWLTNLIEFGNRFIEVKQISVISKRWTLQNLIARFRSLVYIKNKSAPRTEPYVAPYKTEAKFDS